MTTLVTGGGGFLGQAIIRLLLDRGEKVRSLTRGDYPELSTLGVTQYKGDIADPSVVRSAVEGCDIVYHVAAKAGVWGKREDYYLPNVTGTRNVIDACRDCGIRRLVYTSSPSVVFNGRDMEGVDESTPYPEHFLSWYPETKAKAEQMVLAANSTGLATVALRPHLIWGPGDNQLVPRILERGKSGALRRVGRQDRLVDTVYIDNAAQAHLDAADHLATESAVAGKAYFISNGEPLPLWDIINRILAAGQVPPVTRTIPPRFAYVLGWLMEITYRTLNLPGEPRITRFVAEELATAHWFDLSAAKEDFGYDPRVSIDEGMERLAAWLKRESGDA